MLKIIRAESKKCLLMNASPPLSKPLAPKSDSSKVAKLFHEWSPQISQKRRRQNHGFRHARNGTSATSNSNLLSKNKNSTAPKELKASEISKDTSLTLKPLTVTTERRFLEEHKCQPTTNWTNLSKLSHTSIQNFFSTTENSCFPPINSGELTIHMTQTLYKNETTRNYNTRSANKSTLMKPTTDFSTKNSTTRSNSKEALITKSSNQQQKFQQLQNKSSQTVLTTATHSPMYSNNYTNSLFKNNSNTNPQKPSKHYILTTKNYSTMSSNNSSNSPLKQNSKTNPRNPSQRNTATTKSYSTKSSNKLNLISAQEAAAHVKSNSVVFVEGVVGTPKVLMNAMYDHVKGNNIQGVTVLDVFSLYPYETMTLEDDCVRRLSFFVSPYTRPYISAGKAEYIPLMLNDLPLMFSRRYFSPEVALISVSPPDGAGFVSLGTNVTELLEVIAASKLVIAQVNDKMPRSQGAAIIHVDQIDYGVEVSYDLFTPVSEPVTDLDRTIAKLICEELVEDEATLQIGLGKIPEAILSQISQQKNLGVHTELLTTGILPLIQGGIINNSKKSIDRDIITATLLLGDQALYDYVNNNETVQMKPCSYSNDPAIIRQNHRMTAINTCLEIDLTGQVVSDSIGSSIYSGFGGQVDFMRGAMTSLDGKGKAILALPSRDERTGRSKIVSRLTPGAGVVCTRAHVQHLVTEYGRTELCGRSTRQRAHELIRLAHPEHREQLEKEAYDLLGVMPCA